MPKIGDLPPKLDAKPGVSLVCTFDTSSDVGQIHGERGTTYSFPVVLDDGTKALLNGGERLLTAMRMAIGNATGTFRLKVTPSGAKGTLAREWNVEKVG